jgi:hypothetical protein
MANKTYTKGILLWIDDNLDSESLPPDIWSEVFGEQSDRIFRLMDISLEVAVSYEEAMEIIPKFDSYLETGTFVFCVLDLVIPAKLGSQAEMQFGLAVARELRNHGIQFAFLSSNAGGVGFLQKEQLSAIPYYVKEPGKIWKFPDTLVLKVLSEFRRHITWISVEDIIENIHPASDLITAYHLIPETFAYFPFFGLHREFVERCEYRSTYSLPRVFAVGSYQKHCDEFVQQALSILLYQTCLQNPDQYRILFGSAHDKAYLLQLKREDIRTDSEVISIIRIDTGKSSVDDLVHLVSASSSRAGRTIFIMPNDESVDLYTEFLREKQIYTIEELPQIRFGDLSQREELVRHSCMLAFQHWIRSNLSGEAVLLDKGSLTYPELFINPIYWNILLATQQAPEELSDPFEIVNELNLALQNMDKNQDAAVKEMLENGNPIAYHYLLRIGQQTLDETGYKKELVIWREQALDFWLKTSWQYPYGILESFTWQEDANTSRQKLLAHNQDAFQDSCYEILVNILNEFRETANDKPSPKQQDLQTVDRFVHALGNLDFLNKDIKDVNWEVLQQMRWPHRHYPLCSAIHRRLREAGRFLWIQPEGLDLALTLPVGRMRYRSLGSTIDRYWSVISWINSVANQLPLGWKKEIGYLAEIIENNRVADAWQSGEKQKIWHAFHSLLSNAGPVMYITDKLIQGTPIHGGGRSISQELASVHGFGTHLKRLRGSRERRLRDYLVMPIGDNELAADAARLRQVYTYYQKIKDQIGPAAAERGRDLEKTFISFLEAINAADQSQNEGPITKGKGDSNSISNAIVNFLSDDKLKMNGEGWHIEDLGEKTATFFPQHGDTESLLVGTKSDYAWQLLDTFQRVENISRRYRYYDGYHFLAALNDIRVENKIVPPVPLEMIETILDLFIASIEGIISQLSWCVSISGEEELAEGIHPHGIYVLPPSQFKPPPIEELSKVLKVKKSDKEWEVFTLGIPGASTVSNLTYTTDYTTVSYGK